MNRFTQFLFICIILTSALLEGCGKDNQNFYASGVAPGGGTLTRNGQSAQLFITASSVSWRGSEQRVTITLSNRFYVTPGVLGTAETIQQLSFDIPTNQIGQPVSVNSTIARFTETPPTGNLSNSPVTTAFTSTQATGTYTLFSFWDDPAILNPDHANGTFDVTFTDGQGNTRQISGGFFNF